MKIAMINEFSQAAKNDLVVSVLKLHYSWANLAI